MNKTEKMKKVMTSTAAYWFGVVALGTFFGFSLHLASAWVSPSSNPPSGNVGAPLSTGDSTQYKSGGLGIEGLLRLYSQVSVGNSGINDGQAFIVNKAGDVMVTGADDSRWGMYKYASDGTYNEKMALESNGGVRFLNANDNARTQNLLNIGADNLGMVIVGGNGVGASDVHVSGGTDSRWALYAGPKNYAVFDWDGNCDSGDCEDGRGRIGIGGDALAGYNINLHGTVFANSLTTHNLIADSVTTNQLNQTSDERLKENIRTISDPLNKITNLRGVTFDWRKDIQGRENADDGRQMGVIAQEVEKVVPEVVKGGDDGGYKSVEYGNLSALLIEGMKQQQKEIEALKKIVCGDHPDSEACK